MRRWSERFSIVACTRACVCACVVACAIGCGSGAFNGSIGVRARRDPESGVVLVTDVPAGLGGAKAGIEPGDRILAVDGVPVAQMTVDVFHRAVRGPIGSHVRLTIQRGDMIVDVEVERSPLQEPKEPKAKE
jgi:C-terminal processing protease CtpA/Prc